MVKLFQTLIEPYIFCRVRHQTEQTWGKIFTCQRNKHYVPSSVTLEISFLFTVEGTINDISFQDNVKGSFLMC